MILGFFLDRIFDNKKDKLFCFVFAFCRGRFSAIFDLVLYLQSEGLNISWIYLGAITFQYLKTVFTIQYSTLSLAGGHFIFPECEGPTWDLRSKFSQKQIHLFWALCSLGFKLFFKRGKDGEKHNQNVAKLVLLIIVFYMQGLGTCCDDTGIWFAFIFFRTFPAIAFSLKLESSWKPRYSTVLCWLMEWPTKNILISIKPLAFEKRTDLVLCSPKWIDSLLSMNHWHSDKNYLFKTFSV